MDGTVTAYDNLKNKNNKKLFKDMVKLYDQKLYKKAMKNWDKILDTEPNHGETLSMKALILNTIGKKTLAYETIKKGVSQNFNSFTSWHIMGLIHRSDKNYSEAKSAFSQSAKKDDGNLKIIRDLLVLEMQVRDYAGASNSIDIIMKTQARNKIYCCTYVMMHHLNGEYEKAINFIEQNREFMTTKQSKNDMSELYIYEAIIYKDYGKYEEAIKLLIDNEDKIFDKTFRLEFLAELNTLIDNHTDAEKYYEELIKRNPSCVKYYHGLFKSKGINIDDLDKDGYEQIQKILSDKIAEHPRLLFLKRFLLNYCSEREIFTTNFEPYAKQFLEKGIPSLVYDIENMIANNPMKFEVVKMTFTRYLESMEKDLTIDDEEQDPLQQCFLYMFLSQVYHIEGDYLKALELIEKAIEHTPTFFELWQFKAKVMESLGDYKESELAYKSAHDLDTADRFLNAEWARYVLRNNKQEEANDIMKRWSGDPTTDEITSFEYQNMWYEVESGRCQYRLKNYLEAFKYFHYIDKHLVTMSQDFFDFHFYTIRRFQFRSYLNTAKMQDNIRTNTHVQNGVVEMLKVLHKFHKQADSSDEGEQEKFIKWLDEEVAKHPDRDENLHDWNEYSPLVDPLDKEFDPTSAKSLKKIVGKGIAAEASERIAYGLKYNPTNKDFHYYAVKWHLKSKRYKEAIESLKFLNLNFPECAKTIYSNTRAQLFFSDDSVRSKIKPKQLSPIDESIKGFTAEKEAKAYFEESLWGPNSCSLISQKFYLKGLQKLFNETLTKDHFKIAFDILSSNQNDSDKKNVLQHLEYVKKIVKMTPDDYKDEFVEMWDQIFYKFKEINQGDEPTTQ